MMRYAICNETFQDWPFEKAFAFAAECGYGGVEIAPFTIHPDAREIDAAKRTEVRRQVETAGLEVTGLHWLLAKTEGFYMTTPDDDVRRKTADYFIELARLCADLGGKYLVCGSPHQRNLLEGVSHAQAMDLAADLFTRVVPALEENDVLLTLEPLAPAETDFLQTAESAVALIRKIGSPHLRLHLDCKAMASESKPIEQLIRENRDDLATFHANDPNLQGPGFGDLEFAPILTALAEVEFTNWVSVEVFDYSPGVESLVRDSIEYLKRTEAALGG
jgi:sugar phosphate isomerase/epimerase